MDIFLNGLKACDTCRKALKSLRDHGHTVTFRDLRENPPTAQEISNWQTAVGLGILNKRSTTWRQLSPEEQSADSVDLMANHPTLIKRPVIQVGDQTYLGWTPDIRTKLGSAD